MSLKENGQQIAQNVFATSKRKTYPYFKEKSGVISMKFPKNKYQTPHFLGRMNFYRFFLSQPHFGASKGLM